MCHRMRRLSAAASILLALAAGPAVSQDEQGWRQALRLQLAAEKDCEAAFYTNEEVRETDQGRVVSVRVQCSDGRAFDAVRQPGDPRFTLRSCTAAETC